MQLDQNIAESLYGKKVLVGGIEGLSRFVVSSHDANALQLFGNAAGVVGVIPGQTMKFLAGRSREVFDDDGVIAGGHVLSSLASENGWQHQCRCD